MSLLKSEEFHFPLKKSTRGLPLQWLASTCQKEKAYNPIFEKSTQSTSLTWLAPPPSTNEYFPLFQNSTRSLYSNVVGTAVMINEVTPIQSKNPLEGFIPRRGQPRAVPPKKCINDLLPSRLQFLLIFIHFHPRHSIVWMRTYSKSKPSSALDPNWPSWSTQELGNIDPDSAKIAALLCIKKNKELCLIYKPTPIKINDGTISGIIGNMFNDGSLPAFSGMM